MTEGTINDKNDRKEGKDKPMREKQAEVVILG